MHWRGDTAKVERVGGCHVVVLAVELIDKKAKRIKYIVALSGHQTMTMHTTANKKHPGAMEERRGMRRDQRGVQG